MPKNNRSFCLEAYIIKTEPLGDIHKRLTLFTRQQGLIPVVAHGAQKLTGKLHAASELFCRGRFFLYHEPIKDNYKITDAVILNSYLGLRQSLKRFYWANLMAETVLVSFAGGEAGERLFDLYQETLTNLNQYPEKSFCFPGLQYILRFLQLTGNELEISECANCKHRFNEQESIFYQPGRNQIFCKNCFRGSMLELSAGALAYWRKTIELSLADALKFRLAERALASFQSFCYALLQDRLDRELKSVKIGREFL